MRMHPRSFPLWLNLALAATLASAPAFADNEAHFDRTIRITGPADLDVQTGSGTITVRVGSSGTVEIHGTISAQPGSDSDVEQRIQEIEADPPIEQTGNSIRVGHKENQERWRDISVSFELVVPADSKLHSESGSGDQSVDGIAGPVDSSSGSGELKISHIGGEVRARAGSGGIELSLIHGNVRAAAGSGTIHASGIAGGIVASAGSGDFRLEQSAPGDVEVSAGSGNIEIRGVQGSLRATAGSGNIGAQGEPSGEWRLHSGSGNVTVELPEEAAFDLSARTNSGHIENRHALSIQGGANARELQGKARGGGARVDLSTSSGSIDIR